MIDKKLIEKYEEEKVEKPILNAVIDQDIKDRLDQIANENEISVSKLVRIILKEFFNNQNNGDS